MLARLLNLGLLVLAGLLLAACGQPPTPIVLSEAEATQQALSAQAGPPTSPVLATLPAAVAPATAPAENLRLVVGSVPGLEPAHFGDVVSVQVQALRYESLLAYDEAGTLQPLLAEALPVPSPDGLAWTMTLRSGILWHDGTPLDSTQVAARLTRILDSTDYVGTMPVEVFIFQQVVTAVDAADRLLTFRLREPFADFPHLLASSALAVVHESGAGTGPFMLVDDTTMDSDFQFVPNPAYHGGSPLAGGVEVIIWEDGLSGPALPDGELFVGLDTPPEQLPDGVVKVDGLPRRYWLLLDTTVPPLDRLAVQQAFAASMDDSSLAYDLFANAQLPDGFDLVVWNMLVDLTAWSGETIQARFSGSPVHVTVQPVDWERLKPGQVGDEVRPGAYLLAWGKDWVGQWWTGWLSNVDGAATLSGVLLGSEPTFIYRQEALVGLGMAVDRLPRITAQTHLPPQPAGVVP